jgi:hypothetical protein
MARLEPIANGTGWIDELTDDQCLEVLWLYLDDPDTFFAEHPKRLLGQALRYALKKVAEEAGTSS